jgi:hypothetical protein
LKEVRNLRLEYGFSNASIANLDETPLFFNMGISKATAKKGIKQVIIQIQNQEKYSFYCFTCNYRRWR